MAKKRGGRKKWGTGEEEILVSVWCTTRQRSCTDINTARKRDPTASSKSWKWTGRKKRRYENQKRVNNHRKTPLRHQVYFYAGQLAVWALIYATRGPDTTRVSHTMCWDRASIHKDGKKPVFLVHSCTLSCGELGNGYFCHNAWLLKLLWAVEIGVE